MKSKRIASNERLFLLIVLILCAVLSGFLSNSACVAIFLPIVSAVAKASEGIITKKNTYMAIGAVAVAGGCCTLVGSTPQIIANGILQETAGCTPMGFFGVTKGGLLVTVIVILYYCTIGYRIQRHIRIEETADTEQEEETHTVNRRKAILACGIFLGCIICFVIGVGTVGTVALLGAALCIATKCISETKALATMDWRAVAIMGGALGFSKGLNESGTIQLVAEKTVALFGGEHANPLVICVALFALAVVLTNLMSNAACAAILVPLGVAIALAIHVDPTTFTVVIVLGADISYVTPIASPPVTMTLAGGYRFLDYVKVGGPLAILITLTVPLLTCALYGL